MNRHQRRLVGLAAVAAGLAAVLGVWLWAAVALMVSEFDAVQRDQVGQWFGPRLPILALSVLVLAAGLAAVVNLAWRRWVDAPTQLLEQARSQLAVEQPAPLQPTGGDGSLRGLAIVIDALLQNRRRLRDDVAAQVAEGSKRVEQERARLAALMSELTQSVVVCNLDGRVLLYNNRARLQFRALSDAPTLAGGAELLHSPKHEAEGSPSPR